jgi:type VI secretion system protein ImpB
VQFTVANTLQPGSGGKIGVDLTFETLDDFNPEAVARRVGPLKELLDLRTKLADLRGNLQGNDKLEEILQSTINDASAMKKLESEVGLQGGSDA